MSRFDDFDDEIDDVTPAEDDAYDDDEMPLMGMISLNDLSGDEFSDDEALDDEDDGIEEWDSWGDEQMERVCVICGDEFDPRSLRSGSQWRNRCNECNEFDDVKPTIHEQTRSLIEGVSAERERQRRGK